MLGSDVVDYLAAYAARLAGRPSDAHEKAGRRLAAALGRLHAVVSQKLGDNAALQRCDREAGAEGSARPRTASRVVRAIEEATQADAAFAAALHRVLDEIREADVQASPSHPGANEAATGALFSEPWGQASVAGRFVASLSGASARTVGWSAYLT